MNRVAQHPARAFAVALAAVGTLSIMDAVMKGLVLAIGIYAVSIWRAAANLGFSAIMYLPQRPALPKRRVMEIHVLRGAIVTLMAFLFFWGIGRVPLAQAIALTFIAPLIALLLAGIVLGEKIGGRSIAGSLAAFAGVVLIVIAQLNADLGSVALLGSGAIASALCYAANIVLMRHQAVAARPLEINFFQALTVALLWLAALPFFGLPVAPDQHWPAILVASFLSTLGGLLFSWAYARAEASYLAVTEYSAFLWASALGWLVFHERLGPFTVVGAAMIVGGCLVASWGRQAVAPEIEAA